MNKIILVAEDDEDDRLLLLAAMKEAGVHDSVRMVANGAEVLDYLFGMGAYNDRDKHPFPSLLLLDIKMPGRDGFEVLAQARADEIFRSLPIIILSASCQPQDIERAYRLGANAYLVKPSNISELRQMMEALKGFWIEFNRFPASLTSERSRAS